MRTITACTLDCPDACSLVVETGDDGKIKIKGNPEHPYTRGFTCAKIRRYPLRQLGEPRLTEPQLREGSGWRGISWGEALDLCAAKIQELRPQPLSMLHVQGGGQKGICNQVTTHLFNLLGASGTRGSLCDAAGEAADLLDFGAIDTNDIQDLVQAKWIVNWGRDLTRTSVHQVALVSRARKAGARMLTISPGGDVCRDLSDETIRINPGCDRFLAAAVMVLLLKRGRIDPRAARRTKGWPEFAALIQEPGLEELARAAGAPLPQVELLADWYGRDEPVASLVGWGLQRHPFGCQSVRFINALAMLSGQIGVKCGGVYFGLSSARNFNTAWKTPRAWGRTLLFPRLGAEILAADPPVKFIWVNSSNPVNQVPDCNLNARAFEQTPFVVVVDGYMTDTARRADLILPSALNLEIEDLVGSYSHNYVNYVRPAWDAPGQAKPDHQIVRELAMRLDPPIDIPPLDELMEMCLDSVHIAEDLSQLREKGFTRAKRPSLAFADLQFAHEDGLYHLPLELSPEPEAPEGFPLRLLSLIRGSALHSQMGPEEHRYPPLAWLAPESPAWQAFDPRREVFLASPLGRMRVEPARMEGLHPLSLVYRRDDWMSLGGGVNRVISQCTTDRGDNAAFYGQYVRLEN